MIRRLAAERVPKAVIARRLGISRTTVVKAVASQGPPKYERRPAGTSFTPFEARVRQLLEETPDMPATVLAERVGWTGSIRWFRDNVNRVRADHARIDPADRLTWAAGDAAQCDLWFPPRKVLLEDGSRTLLPVLVMTCAHSRFTLGRMIPTRKTEDLLLGSWSLLEQLGRVPRRLIWDNESGIGRRKLTEPAAVFAGHARDQGGAAAAAGSGVQGRGRTTERVVRDLVHAGSGLCVTGGLQHPVHRLAEHGELPGGAHDQDPPGRRARGRQGSDVAVAAGGDAPGVAQPHPPGSGLLRACRHQRLLR